MLFLTLNSIYNSRNYYRLLNRRLSICCSSIYNSRNYYRLLNVCLKVQIDYIYNSRNYYRLLNRQFRADRTLIYNSRNYYRLLNSTVRPRGAASTTVEITIGYLTPFLCFYTIFCLVTIIFDYFFIYFTHIY